MTKVLYIESIARKTLYLNMVRDKMVLLLFLTLGKAKVYFKSFNTRLPLSLNKVLNMYS
jgi:hypothetical protein